MKRRHAVRRGLRLLRRSVALGMVFSALWLISLTVQLPSPGQLAQRLGEDRDFAVHILSAQLAYLPDPVSSLDHWGQLLVRQSPLLRSAEKTVQERLAQLSQPEPTLPMDPGDGDDPEEELWAPLPNAPIVEHTAVGTDDGSFLKQQELYLKNETDLQVDLAALASQPLGLELEEGPQILIYHTHGSEAYTQTEQSRYVESDAYRTTDCTRNVVQVGEEMARVFRDMGFEVLHDTTLYDYPVYSGAYERSRAGVTQRLEEYPTIRFVLDVHRDALVDRDGSAYKLIAQEQEEKVAQVMLVVGSDASGAAHPHWRENLSLALQVQLALTKEHTQLARPIVLRSTRFNQDITTGSLLVEVGGHGNTLEEAMAGAQMFARTVGQLLEDLDQPS